MHLDEEQVQRLLHGELKPPAEASVREHLAGCADCNRRVAEVKREEEEVFALLTHVDHSPPRIDAGAIAARARGRDFGWGRLAAGFLLTLGFAGAVYALPGSPLRGWVQAVVQRKEVRPDPSSAVSVPAQAADAGKGVAGIAVSPGRELLILFTSRQAAGHAIITLADGPEVTVRALTGAASFTSGADRLVIDNPSSSATFEIQIPRAAPRVEIRVGEDRIFLKEGSRVSPEKCSKQCSLLMST
ncbi:MAG: anti-sigma factor [Gemmatimonadaceae bacterium]